MLNVSITLIFLLMGFAIVVHLFVEKTMWKVDQTSTCQSRNSKVTSSFRLLVRPALSPALHCCPRSFIPMSIRSL